MIWRAVALTWGVALAARADVTLTTVSTTGVETAAGSTYNFGNIAQGASATVRIRARDNSATAAIQIVVLGVVGSGFALSGAPSIPWVLAPGSAQDFDVVFTAGAAGAYSGNLQVNSVSLILLATSSPAPVLTVLPGCTGTAASPGAAFSGSINFGQVQIGQLRVCAFTLQNVAATPVDVSTLAVAGSGYQGPVDLAPPLTLAAQQSAPFSIDFTASQPGVINGTLTTDTGVYQLTATVPVPQLPLPLLTFDTLIPRSGEQHTLSMSLTVPAPVAATGFVNLGFTPATTLVADDPAVMFVATGTRTLPFSVPAGSTQVSIAGAAGAVFQTGTTAGQIVFTISGVAQGIDGDPTAALRIAPSTVTIDGATFTARPGNLDVSIVGFDNTYSMGAMSFTFYDTSGKAIPPGTIQADFTQSFQQFFAGSTDGSMFQILVSFPISGSMLTLGSAGASLLNSAGTATINNLALQ